MQVPSFPLSTLSHQPNTHCPHRDDITYYYFLNKRRRSASSDTDDSTTTNSNNNNINDTTSPYGPISRPRLHRIRDTPDFTSSPSSLSSPAASSPVLPLPMSRSPINFEEDRQQERLVHAAKLLLAARDRVLTLSEQRVRILYLLF